MKVSHVLTSVNLEPLYIDFIPMFIKHWSHLFPEVTIMIILVAEDIPEKYKDYEKCITLFKPIEGIPTSFQAMCIRNLYPAIIDTKHSVIITDMDMMPMNRSYYIDPIKEITLDKFVTYRDVLVDIQEYPMCYNTATPDIWSNVFSINTLDDVINTLKSWYSISNYARTNPSLKGICNFDQKILYKKLQEFQTRTNDLIVLNDDICKYNRYDRIHQLFNTDGSLIHYNDIINLKFHDYHCLRPYNRYKTQNDTITNALCNNTKIS